MELEQTSRDEEGSNEDIWRTRDPGRKNSQWKDPKDRTYSFFKDLKEDWWL